MQENVLSCIFFGISKTLSTAVGSLSKLPVNKSGMGLQNPEKWSEDKYTSFLCAIYKLIGAVTCETEFSTADRIWSVKEERQGGRKYRDDVNDAKLRVIVSDQSASKERLFLHTKYPGSRMSVCGTTIMGTVIHATEFSDFYMLIIMLTPLTFTRNVTVACKRFMCVTK